MKDRHPNGPKCKEVLHKINLMLDCECAQDEESHCLEHMKECPGCLEAYNIEKSFKEFVHLKSKKQAVPPSLIKAIRERIGEID